MKKITIFSLLLLNTGCFNVADKDDEKKRDFHEAVTFLAGANSKYCGKAFSDKDEIVKECMFNSFYLYESFHANYVFGAGFYGTHRKSFSYNGSELFLVDKGIFSCDGNKELDCMKIYTVERCVNPEPIINEVNEYTNSHPFNCDELININNDI